MRFAIILLLGAAVVSALPAEDPNKIVGGSVTTIETYPYSVALLASANGAWYSQSCGGSIINNRSILTAAHCFLSRSQAWQWKSRIGSTWASSGGTVLDTIQLIHHPLFNRWISDMDFTVLRVTGTIPLGSNQVRAASLAGPNYNVGDNQAVWAIGWGATCAGCSTSEELRHVEIWTVNHNTCVERYNDIRMTVTNNMLCSGWLDVGGRDQCQGDSGGPLLHNGVIVGISSWGLSCAAARYPGVNARVSVASNWIVSNA